ncbi:MAG: hypothetical protein UW81_C0006G0024 [Candidatus Giovannonibacteria bacterium GW2011_GWC2_44_9]|uniref:Type IV pilus assembly protein PilM n=3 Tax=Candidatus Giovannoniibacteriota TaxID=1752738 RepID=A0A0G1IY91_9BACT|nr:MAG: hypothetical protein UW49_C0004G0069 [Candidatus Giovannonibacteria bacterium GW2011_GWB1_44_23]KKT63958.1 MAG: hypothetical protein UW57_C0004G0068 [Candidatus Giovannonibacteria bacterium GW2011_GWA1_44_29]KKT84099.1 MAG: hypothetical protein UW81_C0006G0024 [Candidatus Giovannonibacteria bacterium GW2011_GWC2_44_9]KKT91671.1 MAG: hypothetical protein UW93_C0004G0069 [Parcubacteria group bacterium GW2011_GWC1_45_13]
MAIDLGTASISAVVAVRYEKNYPKSIVDPCEILKVLRYPIDLFGYKINGDEQKLPYILKDGFLKIFKDAYGASHHVDAVLIALSDPFFAYKKAQQKIERANPDKIISESEIDAMVKSIGTDVATKNLFVVGREVLSVKINGYSIENAASYKGRVLETEMIFTLISRTLKDYIENAREKFFPKAATRYYSDSRALWRLLKATENFTDPVLVADIGGEVTEIFWADKNNIEHAGASAFGIRTLSRRISTSLKIDQKDVEAIFRKYTSGTLDETLRTKLERALSPALADWWASLKNVLKNTFTSISAGIVPKRIIISGGGADFTLFSSFLKDSFKKDFGADIEPQILRAEAFQDMLYPSDQLVGGGDIILSALILFADAKKI